MTARGPMLLTVVLAAAASGCSAIGASGPMTGTAARVATAETTHEYRSSVPPAQRAPASPTAEQAILGFANAYINWSARTVAGDMRRLAADSVGQARAAMQLAAAQTGGDYELQRGGIANHGTVESIGALRGHGDEYAVVTLESTSSSDPTVYQGLRPAWHITVATVRSLGPGRWVISGWQPEG